MSKLDFKPITIKDKQIVDQYLQSCQPEISELTFTNLYIWKEAKQTAIAVKNNTLYIKCKNKQGFYFLPPIGKKISQDTIKVLINYSEEKNHPLIMRKIPNKLISLCKTLNLKVHEDQDNFDYIYKTKDLTQLKGRKYDGKRWFIKKFNNNYKFQYIQFLQKHSDCCLKLAEEWINKKKKHTDDYIDEYHALERLIKHTKTLNIEGAFIKIKNRTIAFCFGEKLNKQTYVIHFEKADTDIVGSYQTMNQLFTQKNIYNKFEYINREQDLGIEGIRKAKRSYHPTKMIKKYICTQ